MSVKDLGVVLDSWPTCREHVDATVSKAHNLLWACGVKWGVSPYLYLWLNVSLIWAFTTFAPLV